LHAEDLRCLDGGCRPARQRAHHRELPAGVGTRGVRRQSQPLPESSWLCRRSVRLPVGFGLDGAFEGCQRRIERPGSLGRDQEGLVGFQPRVRQPAQVLPQQAFDLVLAGPVAPFADEGFESVVDAGKLAAALQPPVGPAPAPWC